MFRFAIQFDRGRKDLTQLVQTNSASMALPQNLRLLLADDVRMTRWMLKQILMNISRGRWSVDEAGTAEDALAKVETQAFDVVFLDEDFGYDCVAKKVRKTGTSVTPTMRKVLAGTKTLIIGCTMYVSEEHRQRALAVGQNDVLHKPIRRDNVRHMLAKHLAT